MRVKAKVVDTQSRMESHPSIYMINIEMTPAFPPDSYPFSVISIDMAYDAVERLREQLNELVPRLKEKLDSRTSKPKVKKEPDRESVRSIKERGAQS